MPFSPITVVKANGRTEPFSEDKIIRSLTRAHVPRSYQHEIVEHLVSHLGNRVSSRDIHDQIRAYFGQTKPHLFAKYNLKQAIMEFGPSGYPFERYVGELLRHYGYNCVVGSIVQGKCVTHEVDVVAHKDDQHFIIECKFHNQPGTRSDVKTALYVKARVDDIVERLQLSEHEQFQREKHKGWLVTNTKCTSDAIQYALCAGINVIGWSYPDKGNLQDMVEDAGLYPITVLTSLSQTQKAGLLARDVVLAKNLQQQPELLNELHLSMEELQAARNELEGLFSPEET
ncbi:MAG TPA: restriction endonuclease [Candidatus Saccharimonadia bacterium]|nr:restriction endonuclease [Candidatus Saccharimonadia bacterium]